METQVTRLFGFTEVMGEHADTIRALLFGVLVRLAAPVVTEYQSDLYHDADWLRRNVTEPTAFYFAVRTSGTHIGDAELMRAVVSLSWHGLRMYRVELAQERRMWKAHVTEVYPVANQITDLTPVKAA